MTLLERLLCVAFVVALIAGGFIAGWGSRGLYEENPKGTEAVNLPLTPEVEKPVTRYGPINF